MQNLRLFMVCTLFSTPFLLAFATQSTENKAVSSMPAETKGAVASPRSSVKGGSVIELSSEAQFDELKSSGKLVIFDFHAKWCGPCRSFGPIFEKAAAEFSDVIFVKIDGDDFAPLMKKEKISAFPTLIVYKNGKKVDTHSGAFKLASEFRAYVQRFA